jgi:hypothetical protein
VFTHFSASMADSFLSKILASSPRRPSIDTTKGEKCRRCSRQAPRYFFFFSRSRADNTLSESLDRLDLASTSVIRTSIMQSVLTIETNSRTVNFLHCEVLMWISFSDYSVTGKGYFQLKTRVSKFCPTRGRQLCSQFRPR